MKRIIFAICLLAGSGTCLQIAAATKPNFIIIFTDDQGYNDLGSFGSKTIKTPNIDRLAHEGRKFTSFYVASSVCSASRSALMTGSYPRRIGMAGQVIFPPDNHGMHTDEVTIADMLKDAGYATTAVGKWHLGHRKPFLPTSQGFDSYFGIPYSNDMSHPHNRGRPWGRWDQSWNEPGKMTRAWNTPLMRDETIINLPVDQRTITRRYTDRAIEFVTDNKDKPFFLYLAHSMPHVPLFVPDDVHDPEVMNAYTTVIQHIDSETGRLMKAVRDLGLSGSTYVFFTSDNGPWIELRHHAGSAEPLRGGKGTVYEGGYRVPCIMWAPGRIPEGTVTDALATTMDLLPSIASIASVELKPRGTIDGMDISAIIHGNDESPRHELLFYSSRGILDGIRQDDWKLLFPKKPQLYNLAEDIGETDNLASKMPGKVAQLSKRMHELDDDIARDIRPYGEFIY